MQNCNTFINHNGCFEQQYQAIIMIKTGIVRIYNPVSA